MQKKSPLAHGGGEGKGKGCRGKLEVPAHGGGVFPAVVAVAAAIAGGGVLCAKHEFGSVFVDGRGIQVYTKVEGVQAIDPSGGVGLRVDVTIAAELAGAIAGHAGVAEYQIHARGDRVHGLELQADVVGAVAINLLKTCHQVGDEEELATLVFMGEREGIFKAEAIVVGTFASFAIGVVKVVHVFQGDGLEAIFGDGIFVFGSHGGEEFVFPAEFTLESAAISINIGMGEIFAVASTVIGHELEVEAILLVGVVVGELNTPVGVQAVLVGQSGAFYGVDGGIGHVVVIGKLGGEFTCTHAETLHGFYLLFYPGIVNTGIGEITLGAATGVGAACGKATDTPDNVKLGIRLRVHIYTNP